MAASRRALAILALLGLPLAAWQLGGLARLYLTPPPAQLPPVEQVRVPVNDRSPLARWPWPAAASQELAPGCSLLTAGTPDGTETRLFTCDVRANPRLRWELYDRDEDDAHPRNNSSEFQGRDGVFKVWEHLAPRGQVVAVFNGPFFVIESPYRHTAAVVNHGQVYAYVGNPRWTLLVKGSEFRLVHRATRQQMAPYEWGSGNVQALVVEGKPTALPSPDSRVPLDQVSPESQPGDCGPFTWNDYLKTARTSLGWKDGQFAMLTVTHSRLDGEDAAAGRRRAGKPQGSGWDIADLQQFWLSWGAEGACNLDGGYATQVAWRTPQGPRYLPFCSGDPVPFDKIGPPQSMGVLLYPYLIEKP